MQVSNPFNDMTLGQLLVMTGAVFFIAGATFTLLGLYALRVYKQRKGNTKINKPLNPNEQM